VRPTVVRPPFFMSVKLKKPANVVSENSFKFFLAANLMLNNCLLKGLGLHCAIEC
jgi:hypothetical protein